ncbi:MAG: Ig-like domain-containing protein [Paracoccaceae bacterium]|nr:Ig-like domain-containing protein [Paracoccaceae bacterium]
MRTIFDPHNLWLGPAPAEQLSSGNKLPVAIDDVLSVLKDSGPVSIDVLVNDFDPEGALLTLISATAALGTAVAEADDTVTYTPPAGISGFDTVVYTIADDLGQQRSGQVNVTIAEPQLSVETLPNSTLVIHAEAGLLDITVTSPAKFAGTYSIDPGDLAGGPVNLVAPAISGAVAQGQVLTVESGLWVHDALDMPVQSLQWRLGGADIPGATGPSYTVQSGNVGPGLSVRETQTDIFGQRDATSASVGQFFTPGDDPMLVGWWDAADGTTITEASGEVSIWADKAGGPALIQNNIAWQPQTGTRSLNGLNVLDFNGSSDFLEATARSFPATGDIAFHLALAVDSTANAFEAVLALEATNDFQIDAENAAQFDGRLNAAGIGSPVSLTGGPFAGALILSAVFDRTGAAMAEIFVANVSRATMAYGTAIDATAALHVMTNRSKNAWVDGAVAEVIVTGDITNRTDHHAYLAAKWGLT